MSEELKNKPALFKVTVKEIQRKELPELNDEFASEVSDFDTLEEYKKDIAEKVTERKRKRPRPEKTRTGLSTRLWRTPPWRSRIR